MTSFEFEIGDVVKVDPDATWTSSIGCTHSSGMKGKIGRIASTPDRQGDYEVVDLVSDISDHVSPKFLSPLDEDVISIKIEDLPEVVNNGSSVTAGTAYSSVDKEMGPADYARFATIFYNKALGSLALYREFTRRAEESAVSKQQEAIQEIGDIISRMHGEFAEQVGMILDKFREVDTGE